MDETTTAQGRRRHDRLSGDEASRAIYIDFEGLGRRLGPDGRRAAPAPVLLGVHTRGRGWRTSGVQQWTLQPAFAGMSDRHGDLSSAISHLVRRAERRDRRIVAWSNYELDAVRRYLEDPDLIARFERRYVNAKLLLRHWWNDRRRHEGPAPSALGAFLASLPDVPQDPAPGAVAATLDDLGRTLALEIGRAHV